MDEIICKLNWKIITRRRNTRQIHRHTIIHQTQGHAGGPKINLWTHCGGLFSILGILIPNTLHSGWKFNQSP